MERLTLIDGSIAPWAHKKDILKKLAAYEDIGLSPEELDDFARQACEIRMAAGCKTLEDCHRLFKEGRLIILPCQEANE